MTEPRVTDPVVHETGIWIDYTVSDGRHTHRVTVPLGERSSAEAAIEKWRLLVAEKAVQYQPGCAKGAVP